MTRHYSLARCLECGDYDISEVYLRQRRSDHGPTEEVTATDNRDIEPLVEAAKEARDVIELLKPAKARRLRAALERWEGE